jgi:hypothetical protein
MAMADRGQAVGIALFLAALILVGILLSTLYAPFEEVRNRAENATSNQSVQTGIDRVDTLWDAIPFLSLLIGIVGAVVLAVYQRRAVP